MPSVYRNLKNPDNGESGVRFPLKVGDQAYIDAYVVGGAPNQIVTLTKALTLDGDVYFRYDGSKNEYHSCWYQPVWAGPYQWPYSKGAAILNLKDQANLDKGLLIDFDVGDEIFGITDHNYLYKVQHIQPGNFWPLLTIQSIKTGKIYSGIFSFECFPLKYRPALQCVLGMDVQFVPSIDRKHYPHDCPYCKAPAYLGPINGLDCSAKCGTLRKVS